MSSIKNKISGPPLCLLALAVAVEVALWALSIEVQCVELWIVFLVAPLALSLAKPSKEAGHKYAGKKVVDDSFASSPSVGRKRAAPASNGKSVPTDKSRASPKSAAERQMSSQTAASSERAAQK